jgi:hypothetical protein
MKNTLVGVDTLDPCKQPDAPAETDAEFAKIWTAVQHVGSRLEGLAPDESAAVRPFLIVAVDLALASFVNPSEDTTTLLEKARLELGRVKGVFPAALDAPISLADSDHLRRYIARNGVRFLRSFPDELFLRPSRAPHPDGLYEPYETTPAGALQEPDPEKLWLVEGLWQRNGTGIIGGVAKGAKTWLALDLALSVASGTAALDTFRIHCPGPVLYVSAEGGEGYLKQRLQALCAHRDLRLEALPHRLEIIPRPIRIDTAEGLGRLQATVRAMAPTLLVLDPLVRMHRADENSAASVSALLSPLTELQQAHNLSLILVHHATKQGGKSKEMTGQDFRGSSDFYAWGDSNIFVRKRGNRFVVAAEHRAAPATAKWTLAMTTGEHPRLQVVDGEDDDAAQRLNADEKVDSDILAMLALGPKSLVELRATVKGSNDRIAKALERLQGRRQIDKRGRVWVLISSNGSCPRPLAG